MNTVYRITIAHDGHSHESARNILARIARASGLAGATFTTAHGMAERWEQGNVERATVVETALDNANARTCHAMAGLFAQSAMIHFQQSAVYVTVNGANPQIWERETYSGSPRWIPSTPEDVVS